MSKFVSAVRNLGLMPLARTLVEKPFGWIGFSVVPTAQISSGNWLGLREYPIRTILDIGANRGLWALQAHRGFPEATIHAFEPLPDVFDELKSVADGSGGKIVAHNYGLGEKSGQSTFEVSVNFRATSSILTMTDITHELFPGSYEKKPITIDVNTLDEIIPTLIPAFEPDLLIKMDVQGFEDRIIRGGMETFGSARAVLLEVLIDELYEGQAEFSAIFKLLDGLNFVFVGTYDQYCDPKTGRVVFLDAVFVKKS